MKRTAKSVKGLHPVRAGLLSQNDELFHLMMQSVKDYAIFLLDTEGHVISWNEGARNIKGYSAEEIIGKHISVFYTREDVDNEEPSYNLKMAGLYDSYEKEGWRIRKDGSRFWADVVFTALYDKQHHLKGYAKVTRDITDRVKAETALEQVKEELEQKVRERTAELTNIFERITDAFIALDKNFCYTYINQKAEELVHKNATALMGKCVWDVFPDVRDSVTYRTFVQAMETQQYICNTDYYAPLDLIMEIYVYPSPKGLSVFIKDITEKKRTEEKVQALHEELINKEKRYRYLFENNPMPMMMLDIQSFGFLDANIAALQHYGYTREEFLSMTAADIRPENEREKLEKMNWRKFDYGSVINRGIWKHLKKDGSAISVEIITRDIEFENREVRLLLSNDVTEKVRAEEKLANSEKIYKTIASSIPGSVVCLLDSDWRYLLIEGDMLESLGYSKEKLLGNKAADVLSAERYSVVKQDFERVFKGESFTTEACRYGYETISRYVPLKGENNTVDFVLVFVIDVTELKKAQHDIAELNRSLEEKVAERTVQLEAVNKELEAFSYSVSHDLRAPLRAINGYAKIMQEDYGTTLLDAESNRLLAVIQQNAKQMGVLIDDLLAFSRLGRKEIQKVLINMNDLVNAVIPEINKTIANTATIKIGELHPVKGDYTLIYQVIVNLLSNAVKYSSKKADPVIQLSSKQENGKVVYAIEDNGVGFDMQYVHKLFGVFQRLHTSEEFDGTGVGLAIVKRIISKHDGSVWAEGKPGEGATFYFNLPQYQS